MLATQSNGAAAAGGVALVLMHFLGGSTREWDEVVTTLGPGVRTLALDLPGFGGSAGIPGYTVAEMADAVEETIASAGFDRYLVVGHSMSGKVAAVIARREQARQDAGERCGLKGLVLIAPSPPGPEPMTEEKRSFMLGGLGTRRENDPAGEASRARDYITKNEERDIPERPLERSVQEVLRMNRTAWVAWVERGSREDWAERVGVLRLPTLVVAGEKDRSLGPEIQERVTMPHLASGELRSVKGCSHLIPLERPEELAGMLREFLAKLAEADSPLGSASTAEQKFVIGLAPAALPAAYAAFLRSDRVSEPTREVLLQRLAGPSQTDVLSVDQMRTLRAVCERVVPQQGTNVDLAGTIAARLATGKGDGWRYAVLPPDLEAYRQQLDHLAAAGFAELDPAGQDRCLEELNRQAGSAPARWFEDLRSDATEAYVSHPAIMARLGFSGPGVGGAFTPDKGYVAIEIGQVEDWEPRASIPAAMGDL